MLTSLSIRDIVLIDQLRIVFGDGLSVMTGETGAGKSILLDSLSLALGARGDGALVRAGQNQGQVVAEFDVPHGHGVHGILKENGLDEEGAVVLKRVQSADGRSRAYVNDTPVSVGLLRTLGARLVEIHGQHDDRALIDPDLHRSILDLYGGHGADLMSVSEAHSAWKRAQSALRTHERAIEEARREFDYLTASVAELTALDAAAGEEERLAESRQTMMAHEKVAGDLGEASDILNGNGSPIPIIADLWRRLERKEEVKALVGGAVDGLGRALDALEESRSALEMAIRQSEFDPVHLEQTEERLFALRAAGRKFNVPPDRLPDILDTMRQDLQAIESGEETLIALTKALEEARAILDRKAEALSQRRRKAVRDLQTAVAAELPDLKLGRAEFSVSIESRPEQPQETGIDSVEFRVRTNPGTKAGPIMKVASGGELSRFLLALKVAIAERGSAPTLVFDEIDTGVGGAVAEAIGVRLERLSRSVQVLSVTHAPQVAARARGHVLIKKDEAGPEQVFTRIEILDAETRREEIARMLAGAQITNEARAAASRLLESAG